MNYPSGLAKPVYQQPEVVKNRKKANLGKELEGYLEATNAAYIQRKQAAVFRQNPEVTVVRKGRQITSAFHRQKAGLDYIGLSSGRSFTFDAKETREKSFPLKNIEPHQVETMKRYTEQGGFAFLLIRFVKQQEVFLLPHDKFLPWWTDAQGEGRKSIPYQWINENCELVGAGSGLALDYLPLIRRTKHMDTQN